MLKIYQNLRKSHKILPNYSMSKRGEKENKMVHSFRN